MMPWARSPHEPAPRAGPPLARLDPGYAVESFCLFLVGFTRFLVFFNGVLVGFSRFLVGFSRFFLVYSRVF